jgi:hypothetical protein
MRVLLSSAIPAFILFAGLTVTGLPAAAQNAAGGQNGAQQQQNEQPTTDPEKEQTFSGKIMKANGKLVLFDADSKTSYELSDQQKAKAFVNKNVKVTGTLDPSTGTIRISSIEPVS